jgi:hypothetical protein
MLVIYFSHLYKVYWWFVIGVNYRQQWAHRSDCLLEARPTGCPSSPLLASPACHGSSSCNKRGRRRWIRAWEGGRDEIWAPLVRKEERRGLARVVFFAKKSDGGISGLSRNMYHHIRLHVGPMSLETYEMAWFKHTHELRWQVSK